MFGLVPIHDIGMAPIVVRHAEAHKELYIVVAFCLQVCYGFAVHALSSPGGRAMERITYQALKPILPVVGI